MLKLKCSALAGVKTQISQLHACADVMAVLYYSRASPWSAGASWHVYIVLPSILYNFCFENAHRAQQTNQLVRTVLICSAQPEMAPGACCLL